MAYNVCLEEQEVCINIGRTEEYATAYVTDRTWMTKFDKRVADNPKEYTVIEEHVVDGTLIGKTYKFPKRFITLRFKDKELSEEQKLAISERFRTLRESQLKRREED